jgi:type I restriction enzyme R subunit
MNLSPKQIARQKIDATLEVSGWVIQDMKDFNRNASLGVAVREFQLPVGPCDYLLFIDGRETGVIEAKKQGVTLSAVADQSAKYMTQLPAHLAQWETILRFDCESTSDETFFYDTYDPKPRSRRVFAFHQPVSNQ